MWKGLAVSDYIGQEEDSEPDQECHCLPSYGVKYGGEEGFNPFSI